MTSLPVPTTWYTLPSLSATEFILGMLSLGTPLETSLVGVFDDAGRGSRCDIDLPLHRDGVYSAALAEVQDGEYVERKGIDIVGLYCLRSSECRTVIHTEATGLGAELRLQKGEALVFNNHAVLHGRRGPVGDRLLLRIWITRGATDG